MIKIKPSSQLYVSAAFLYTGAVYCILASTIWFLLKILCLYTLAVTGHQYLRRYVFLTDARSIIGLGVQDCFWSLKRLTGDIRLADLRKHNVITQFLLVLYFCTDDEQKVTVLITSHSVGQQAYRRLLVRLNHTYLG